MQQHLKCFLDFFSNFNVLGIWKLKSLYIVEREMFSFTYIHYKQM